MTIENLKSQLLDCSWPASTEEGFWFPASFSQRALWFIQDLNPDNLAYNISIAYQIKGGLAENVLLESISRVFDRHEALRTTFTELEGEVYQVIQEVSGFRTPLLDLSEVDDAERAETVNALIDCWIKSRFDLVKGPLARAALVKLGREDSVLLLAFHHTVLDHLSLMTIRDEIVDAYAAITSGKQVQFAPNELAYPDYAAWQVEAQTRENFAEKLALWTERIDERVGCINLPLDHPRPREQSFSGREYRTTIPAPLANQARDYSRGSGVSLFITMLSAYYALLHRYSRQNLLIVGVPFANRTRPELESVVGLFINTLPLPLRIDAAMSFKEIVSEVRSLAIQVQANQDVPLEFIMEAVRPVRDPAFNPLFQVGFTLQDPPVAMTLPGVEVTDLELHSGASMYDLHVWLWENPAGDMGFQIWYDDAILERESIERLSGHFKELLQRCLGEPGAAVGTLPFLTTDEKNLFDSWNRTQADWREQDLLPACLFERDRELEHPAVMCGDVCFSHRELKTLSVKVANFLTGHGVAAGDLVGVLMSREADLIPTLLGILELGAGYVPLDPGHPRERIGFILADADVKLVCAQQATRAVLQDSAHRVVEIDKHWQDIVGAEDHPLFPAPADPEAIAYVIHTSGSTGRPKGVMVPHRAVSNFLRAMAEVPGLDCGDRLLAVTTISFDISVLEMFLPILVGGTVVIGDRSTVSDGMQLRRRLEAGDITSMQATPATWRMLLQAGWQGDHGLKVLCGGEPLPRDLAQELVPKVAALWNLYGPTECTVWCTAGQVLDGQSRITIGRPISNYRAYVLDERRQVQPLGIPGELYIGGRGVALGYLNRDELTAEKFAADPFARDGSRMYATGDLARWTEDGELEHLGRIDTQVKVRGFRIELGEIESTLVEHSDVLEAVVNPWQVSSDDQRLVAYLRLPEGRSLQTNDIRKFLRTRLPDYMIPAHFLSIAEIPLSPSGKVDRKRLPGPAQVGPGAASNYEAPVTETEKALAEIWQQVIGLPRVGRFDNFFEIGGHSLIAVRAIYETRQRLDHNVALRTMILENLTTIAGQIGKVESVPEATLEPSPLVRSVSRIKSWIKGGSSER